MGGQEYAVKTITESFSTVTVRRRLSSCLFATPEVIAAALTGGGRNRRNSYAYHTHGFGGHRVSQTPCGQVSYMFQFRIKSLLSTTAVIAVLLVTPVEALAMMLFLAMFGLVFVGVGLILLGLVKFFFA